MRSVRSLLFVFALAVAPAAETVEQPFRGITHITRTETAPRNLRMHIVRIDLAAPGLRFKLTPPSGARETVRQTTLEYLKQEHAQIAINAHFFFPFPTPDTEVSLIGFAASEGKIYSGCEKPVQSYALVAHAPALNIDRTNHAAIVHCDPAFSDGTHLKEDVTVWNTVAGSAQIVTDGVKTIPAYEPDGVLTPGGPNSYSNAKSWYDASNARTAIGLSKDNRTLILFTVDARPGLPVGEVADLLIHDYGVYNALNLDGGGSTTLAMEDPATHTPAIVNTSSDNSAGRSVGSNLAVFAAAKF